MRDMHSTLVLLKSQENVLSAGESFTWYNRSRSRLATTLLCKVHALGESVWQTIMHALGVIGIGMWSWPTYFGWVEIPKSNLWGKAEFARSRECWHLSIGVLINICTMRFAITVMYAIVLLHHDTVQGVSYLGIQALPRPSMSSRSRVFPQGVGGWPKACRGMLTLPKAFKTCVASFGQEANLGGWTKPAFLLLGQKWDPAFCFQESE